MWRKGHGISHPTQVPVLALPLACFYSNLSKLLNFSGSHFLHLQSEVLLGGVAVRIKLYDVWQVSGTWWVLRDWPSVSFGKKDELRTQCRGGLWDPVGPMGSFSHP